MQTENYFQGLEAAIQTLRKTACYGMNSDKPDFEWPTADDLLQMPKKMEIKLKDL